MEQLLEELLAASRPYTREGRLADYIPELSKADPNALGIYVVSSDGKHSWAGSYNQPFTIQSIVKPILLLLALMDNGIDAVRARVGVEATGKPFDAINTSEQALANGFMMPITYPNGDSITLAQQPVKMGKVEQSQAERAHAIGADNEKIFAEFGID